MLDVIISGGIGALVAAVFVFIVGHFPILYRVNRLEVEVLSLRNAVASNKGNEKQANNRNLMSLAMSEGLSVLMDKNMSNEQKIEKVTQTLQANPQLIEVLIKKLGN